MTDQELSTRDLATRSEDEPGSSSETPLPADRSTGASAADDRDTFENTDTDASLSRDQDTAQSTRSRDADSGIDGAPGADEPVASGSGQTPGHEASGAGANHEPLFASDQSARFTTRWQEIQTSFVDEPRDAVSQADTLVADLMQRLAASFSQERERLEAQWGRGDDVSTEDLRVALTRYRSFFDRLLSA
jgi:hypothetical protein